MRVPKECVCVLLYDPITNRGSDYQKGLVYKTKVCVCFNVKIIVVCLLLLEVQWFTQQLCYKGSKIIHGLGGLQSSHITSH